MTNDVDDSTTHVTEPLVTSASSSLAPEDGAVYLNVTCPGTPQPWALYVGMSVSGAIAVLGTVFNLLLLMVMVRQVKRNSRTTRAVLHYHQDPLSSSPYTLLVMNITLVNLLYCSLILPHYLLTYARWTEGAILPVVCPALSFFEYVLGVTEVLTICLIAIERCYSIVRNVPGQFLSRGQAVWSGLGVWCLSAIIQTVFAVKIGFGFNWCQYRCDLLLKPHARLLVYSLLGIVPVCLTAIACWGVIHHILCSRSVRTASCKEQEKISQRARQSTWTILRTLLLYLLCILPLCIYNILDGRGRHREVAILSICPFWLLFIVMTSLFLLDNKKYRRAFCHLVSAGCCRRRRRGGTRAGQQQMLIEGDLQEGDSQTRMQVSPRCLISHLSLKTHPPVAPEEESTSSQLQATTTLSQTPLISAAVATLALGVVADPNREDSGC